MQYICSVTCYSLYKCQEVWPMGDILNNTIKDSPACPDGQKAFKWPWPRASRDFAPLVHMQEYLPSPGSSGPKSWTESSPAQRPRKLPRKPESDLSNLAKWRRSSVERQLWFRVFFSGHTPAPCFFLWPSGTWQQRPLKMSDFSHSTFLTKSHISPLVVNISS